MCSQEFENFAATILRRGRESKYRPEIPFPIMLRQNEQQECVCALLRRWNFIPLSKSVVFLSLANRLSLILCTLLDSWKKSKQTGEWMCCVIPSLSSSTYPPVLVCISENIVGGGGDNKQIPYHFHTSMCEPTIQILMPMWLQTLTIWTQFNFTVGNRF